MKTDLATEGRMPVPGGVLHYRVAGPESAQDVVVFENGLTASFVSTAWLEAALAPHVRFVTYDRPGIGESTSTEPLTMARITEQFLALLTGLGISQTVVVAGHSYGGLIAALHAAQAPERIRALVQVDPTPELDFGQDKMIDGMPLMLRISKLLVQLGLGGRFFSAYKELPQAAYSRVTQSREWMIRCLTGSIPEITLFHQIRDAIAGSKDTRQCRRLVISAAPETQELGAVSKLLLSKEKRHAMAHRVCEIHQQQARQNPASRWMSLPYSHISLISNGDSARQIAKNILEFMRGLS